MLRFLLKKRLNVLLNSPKTHKISETKKSGNPAKAFDKVCYNGLIYKIKQNGVECDLLDTVANFLEERKQRVILNGQY